MNGIPHPHARGERGVNQSDEMPRMTEQQFRDYQARMSGMNQSRAQIQINDLANASTDESELQEQIIAEVRRCGGWVDYSRMDLPTTRPRGSPDLYCFLPERLLIIECKTKTGKQTPEQLGVAMMLEKLGHKVHVIRSFTEFLDLCR
jgi:hypothetical protein